MSVLLAPIQHFLLKLQILLHGVYFNLYFGLLGLLEVVLALGLAGSLRVDLLATMVRLLLLVHLMLVLLMFVVNMNIFLVLLVVADLYVLPSRLLRLRLLRLLLAFLLALFPSLHFLLLIMNFRLHTRFANRYILSQFPYPSGNLHMGHCRVYFISDTISRYFKLKGDQVIHPIGWDSFGLPAQNQAIKRKIQPSLWTESNIESMRNQLKCLGIEFDWEREISTHSPQYYKLTQKLFLLLFSKQLAYQKMAEVFFDPVGMTVLAKEQIDSQGRSWRTGAIAQKKMLKQWYLGITKYAAQLSQNEMEWPEAVKKMQKGWIGHQRGDRIKIRSQRGVQVDCFVNRIQLIRGAVAVLVKKDSESDKLLTQHSVQIKEVNISLPVYREEHDLGPQVTIIIPESSELHAEWAKRRAIKPRQVLQRKPCLSVQPLLKNSGPLDGHTPDQARQPLRKLLAAEQWTSTRLEDWLISRQRGWGCPIPIIHCKSCGAQPVPQSDLPVKLPIKITYDYNQHVISPLQKDLQFLLCKCPKCGKEGRRQTDTMDTFVDSSWYFLRFLDPESKQLVPGNVKEWMPIEYYVGGMQHAIMHLLYARFIYKVLADSYNLGSREPFRHLITQGHVMAKSFRTQQGQYLTPEQAQGQPGLIEEFEKMSKSKLNGVFPEKIVLRYGADALRVGLLFMAPCQSNIQFQEKFIAKMKQFLEKAKANLEQVLSRNHTEYKFDNHPMYFQIAQTVEQYQAAMLSTSKKLHTAIAKLFQLHNHYQANQHDLLPVACLGLLVQPFAPVTFQKLHSKLINNKPLMQALSVQAGIPQLFKGRKTLKIFVNNSLKWSGVVRIPLNKEKFEREWREGGECYWKEGTRSCTLSIVKN